MVYIFILITIIFFGTFKINKLNESLKMKEAIIKIVNTVDKYSSKSFRKKEYKFLFYTNTKQIKIYSLTNKNPVEIIELPKILDYGIPYNDIYENKFVFNSTTDSNLDKAFSIYIFNQNKVKYRISFYLFRTSKIIKINIYKALFSKDIGKEKVLKIYKNEKFMKEG